MEFLGPPGDDLWKMNWITRMQKCKSFGRNIHAYNVYIYIHMYGHICMLHIYTHLQACIYIYIHIKVQLSKRGFSLEVV